jgi:Membrane bound O-acyl transferase family
VNRFWTILTAGNNFSQSLENQKLKSRGRKQLFWPVAGIILAIGLAAATNPARATHVTLDTGIAVLVAEMLLVVILSAHPVGARAGVLIAGLFLLLPLFVTTSPFSRCLLACFMCVPFAAATELLFMPRPASFRARLTQMFAYFHRGQMTRRARGFDAVALMQLIVATAVLATAIAVVKLVSGPSFWQPVRWLAGGIGILAAAEMATACHNFATKLMGLTVPPFFQSPYRSASVSEFWTKRWNLPASELFRKYCFAPLARRSVGLALLTVFAVSAVGHALLAYLGLGRWRMAAACGAFFLVQPLFILAERWMNVRRWRPVAGQAWTLAVLATTSPLFVEPTLKLIERRWGVTDNVLLPTAAVLGFMIVLSSITSLLSLASPSAVELGR